MDLREAFSVLRDMSDSCGMNRDTVFAKVVGIRQTCVLRDDSASSERVTLTRFLLLLVRARIE
jgi:hypothetical protein